MISAFRDGDKIKWIRHGKGSEALATLAMWLDLPTSLILGGQWKLISHCSVHGTAIATATGIGHGIIYLLIINYYLYL